MRVFLFIFFLSLRRRRRERECVRIHFAVARGGDSVFVDKFWLKPKVLLGQGGLEMDYGPPFFSMAGPTGDSDISRRNEEKGGLFIPQKVQVERWRKGGIMRYVIKPIMMIKDASKLEPDGYFACCRCA